MDKITISGLQVNSLIGVYDWERQAKTNLTVDAVLYHDLTDAALSDNVEDTLDYAQVAASIEKCAAESSFQLLEALAAQMISDLFAQFNLQRVAITISKPGILPNADNVAVHLERQR